MLKYSKMTEDEKRAMRSKPMSREEDEALRILDEEASWLLAVNFMSEMADVDSGILVKDPCFSLPLSPADHLGAAFESHPPVGWASEQTRTFDTSIFGLAEGSLEVTVFQGSELGEGYIEVRWKLVTYEGQAFSKGWRIQVRRYTDNKIIYDEFASFENRATVFITKTELGGLDPLHLDLKLTLYPQSEKKDDEKKT